MKLLDISKYGKRLEIVEDGKRDFPQIEHSILETKADELVIFDLTGVEYFGYSYSKQTLRKCLQRLKGGEYAKRRFMLKCMDNESHDFLDGFIAALKEKKLFTLVIEDETDLYKRYYLLGDVKEHIEKTFEIVVKYKAITTADLARLLQESLQNINRRLTILEEMGIIRREKITSKSGGLEYMNYRVEVD